MMSISDNYQVLSDIEHILLKPGMYIGSTQLISEDVFIANDDSIVKKSIEYIAGLQRLYEEILLNAFDQTVREGTNCTEIHVHVDQDSGTISVLNNGQGLPIVLKPELNVYIPEMVFGMLRSGSNYGDEDRITGGTNGLGAKLANIFSTLFILETADSDTKKIYHQEWYDRMSRKTNPKISSLGRKKPYTRITFQPDLEYFKISQLSDDMIALMKKRLVDIGFASSSKVKTYFNDEDLTTKKPEAYMRMYAQVADYEDSFIVDASCERWTIGLSMSTNGFTQASFVNGIHTSLGGSHVDHVMGIICKEVIEKLKTKKIEVKPSDVKNKLALFLKSTIVNPVFDSQTKECLKMSKSKFGSEYIMSDAFRKKLLSGDLMKVLASVSETKLLKDLSKTNGVKTNRLIGVKGLEDANWAGTAKSQDTKLILTEGLSAKTFAMSAITVIGRDRFGIFPLKGKPLNVRGTAISKVSANAEICSIVKILGLKYGEKYKDTRSLRYGGLILLTDSDVDGYHICGLIMNIIHYFWPELLQIGFVGFCSTPIVKIYHNRQVLQSFYSLNDYEEWLRQNPKKNITTKYFKGLGTSTSAEAREALTDIDQKITTFGFDDHADATVELAFDKKLTNARKEWLMERYDRNANIDRSSQDATISDYINKEMIHFSYYDNQRSIPNIMDGLKPSQRKILYTAIKYLSVSEMKVAQFGAKVAEKTDYHHGEVSLMGAIINMGQNYMGSNNINLLEPLGAFGTRLHSGNDAASPRYIFTKLSEIAKQIFDNKDSSLLTYLESDHMQIEPEWFAPVIPMILVNGALGIGSGFSTEILKYNPIDICEHIMSLLDSREPPKELTPWYRGFKGTIDDLGKGKYCTNGCFSFDDDKHSMIITELPIGVSTDDYKDVIEAMIADKDNSTVIDIIYGNSDVIVYMEVVISPKMYPVLKKLPADKIRSLFKLSSKLSCTNMYLFNHEGIITKYPTVDHIIQEFYDVRYQLYVSRREAIIAMLRYELMIAANKVKFIRHVKDGKLNLRSISDQDLLQYLIRNKFDQDRGIYGEPLKDPTLKEFAYLIDMPIRTITEENAKKLKKKQAEKQAELDAILKETPTSLWKADLEQVMESNRIANEVLEEENANAKATTKKSKSKSKKPRASKK